MASDTESVTLHRIDCALNTTLTYATYRVPRHAFGCTGLFVFQDLAPLLYGRTRLICWSNPLWR